MVMKSLRGTGPLPSRFHRRKFRVVSRMAGLPDYERLIRTILSERPSIAGPSAAMRELLGCGAAALDAVEGALIEQSALTETLTSDGLLKALRATEPLVRVYVALVARRANDRALRFLEEVRGCVRARLVRNLCGRDVDPPLPLELRRDLHALVRSGNEMEQDVARWLEVTRRLEETGLRLQVLGFWADKNEKNGLPDPRRFVDPGWTEDRARIAAYLRNGMVAARYIGCSYCRFECGIAEDQMGDAELSDGTWVWPQGLAHYVEKHQVTLPPEFVAHVRAGGYEVKSLLTADDLQSLDFDADCWRAWAASR